MELKDKAPPTFQEWTSDDEAELERIRTMKFDIEDTAIGQQKKVVKKEFKVLFKNMTKDEQLQCIEDMEIARDTGITGPAVDI